MRLGNLDGIVRYSCECMRLLESSWSEHTCALDDLFIMVLVSSHSVKSFVLNTHEALLGELLGVATSGMPRRTALQQLTGSVSGLVASQLETQW